MKKLKNEGGITLVALVITIVILIILAGVLVSLTLGNNGLFNKAKEGKEKYANAQDYEETEIAKMTNSIDNFVGGGRLEKIIKKEELATNLTSLNTRNISATGIENYQTLTEDNFIVEARCLQCAEGDVRGNSNVEIGNLTKTYNQSTGELTVNSSAEYFSRLDILY